MHQIVLRTGRLLLLIGWIGGWMPRAAAQTLYYEEEFEFWTGSPASPAGWSAAAAAGCSSGPACTWRRSDAFAASGSPAPAGCNGSGFFARCHTSGLLFGDVPSLRSPIINLSGAPAGADLRLSFCLINASQGAADPDGVQVLFSADNGATWALQYLDADIYQAWTTVELPIGPAFRSASFRVRFDGLGGGASGDIGIDAFRVTDEAVACQAAASSISSPGDLRICASGSNQIRQFSHSGPVQASYAWLVCDTTGTLEGWSAASAIDFSAYAPARYRVYGASYSGQLDAQPGLPLTAVSASGCLVLSDNFLRVEIDQPQADAEVLSQYNGFPVSRHGAADGMVRVNVSGGFAPYTYAWNSEPPQYTQTASGLQAGSYTVTVTDAIACTASASIAIQAPAPLMAAVSVVKSPSCPGRSDGILLASASGGVPPYQIEWNHAGGSGAVAAGLAAGSYTVRIVDQNQADASVEVVLPDPLPMQIDPELTPVSCAGASDGAIRLRISGGTAPYQAAWSGGYAGDSLAGLAPGTYAVQVTDAGGCRAAGSYELAAPSVLEVRAEAQETMGSWQVAAQVSGGTPPYAYLWSNGETDSVALGLDNGEHLLMVSDARGCEAEAAFRLREVSVSQCHEIYTGFTPDGDGINDAWHLPCVEAYPDNAVEVYNRWGQLIFSASPYANDWNGTRNGLALPAGEYFYTLEIRDGGVSRLVKGTITLLR
ncbi:MAG: gliding motility-associated C-terminal domain-containing protein [Bacteroidia bacterium]|nr:gliding motility-associated C-terminal domain-containing protein [Bacteroidia bacterium]